METQARLNVLYASLVLEEMTSMILGDLLDIDIETSKTLGSKSGSLSFKNKIDLIVDIRAMEKEDAKKFLCFAEIRNQFVHNLKVDTFKSCFDRLEGKDKYLKKLYASSEEKALSDEETLKKYFDSLFIDLNLIFGKLLTKVRDKYFELGKADRATKYGQVLVESINEVLDPPIKKETIEKIIKRTNQKYLEKIKDMNFLEGTNTGNLLSQIKERVK
jgi:hypothetical protein